MMEQIVDYICLHVSYAAPIIFCLLMLAGLNIPISEDLLLLTGGMIASTCAPPGDLFYIYAWLYLGCILSAWEAYWVGRLLGPKLYNIRWLSYLINRGRVEKLSHFYEKYGARTFFVIRFIPGGVRNAFFISAGLGHMPFNKFVIRDALACILFTNVLFYIGYFFGKNYETLAKHFKTYSLVGLSLVLTIGVIIGTILYLRHRNAEKEE